MSFFTDVYYDKGQLYIRGYSGSEPIQQISTGTELNLKLWVDSLESNSSYKSFFNTSLKEVSFSSFNELHSFIKSSPDINQTNIHGNFRLENRYITETQFYTDPDISQIHIGICDIETTSLNGFPKVSDPQEEVIICSIWSSKTQIITSFCLAVDRLDSVEWGDKVSLVICQTEKELLQRVLNFFAEQKFDVISAWNGDIFDYPYLYYRSKKVLSERQSQLFSVWQKVMERTITINGKQYPGVEFIGTPCLDYLTLYKKFVLIRRESYKLDNIAEVELGERKLEYSEYNSLQEFWEKDPIKFYQYNIQDVKLVVALDNKLKLFDLVFTLAYIAKTNFLDIYSPVKTWEALCYNYLWEHNKVIPPMGHFEKDESFTGAYVKTPRPGLYTDIVSFDITSLYPSLIRMLNISPETLRKFPDEYSNIDFLENLLSDIGPSEKVKTLIKELLPSYNATLAINKQCYTKDYPGMFPEIMQLLFDRRAQAKKEKIRCEQELEQLKELAKQQQ